MYSEVGEHNAGYVLCLYLSIDVGFMACISEYLGEGMFKIGVL